MKIKNSLDEKILEEALQWIDLGNKVVIATVIRTWGSSPRPVGSCMIVNNCADFSGSVSGGCVEGDVVRQCVDLLKQDVLFHKNIKFNVSNENAWNVGLACGGEIEILLEKIVNKNSFLKKVINLKNKKKEFSIIKNIDTSESFIFLSEKEIPLQFKKYKKDIELLYKSRKDGLIKNTNIFVKNYQKPIKVVIVGAVHIAQYFIEYAKFLNLEIFVIDPRGYFASEKRFPYANIINLWPQEAFEHCSIDSNTALIALTHDPKIDDPAIHEALKKKCFYIGALGSKKTHENRCNRLKESGFKDTEISKIFGPIGVKFGGRSAPEIALSIIFQLMTEIYKQ